MEATIAVSVGVHLDAVLGDAGLLPIGLLAFGEVVGIDEVVASVVGRVDIDALYAFAVGGGEELEDFEVFAFDDEVAVGLVGVDGAGGIMDEGGATWGEGVAL